MWFAKDDNDGSSDVLQKQWKFECSRKISGLEFTSFSKMLIIILNSELVIVCD